MAKGKNLKPAKVDAKARKQEKNSKETRRKAKQEKTLTRFSNNF